MNKQLNATFSKKKTELKATLTHVRKATICVDCWSKKELTASYLNLPACFFLSLNQQSMSRYTKCETNRTSTHCQVTNQNHNIMFERMEADEKKSNKDNF